jgi:hypothetical protein
VLGLQMLAIAVAVPGALVALEQLRARRRSRRRRRERRPRTTEFDIRLRFSIRRSSRGDKPTQAKLSAGGRQLREKSP